MMLKVLFLASEADPFIKIGGLGDVAGSLPQAIRALSQPTRGASEGVDIRLVIPLHSAFQRDQYDLQHVTSFSIPNIKDPIPADVFTTELNSLPVYLIDSPAIPPDTPVYSSDWEFDAYKYTFFSLAALRLTRELNWQPDILHANDWHTSPAVYSLSLNRENIPFYRNTATLLSVHNLPYLGVGGSSALNTFGLPPASDPRLPEWARQLPLPLGLLTADYIVAVSPTYAKEILTPEFGSGLHEFLQTRANSISGILNGLDIDRWNPAKDSFVLYPYHINDLTARKSNKAALQQEFGLILDEHIPLLAMVNRMDYQKGVDLLPEALRLITDQPWQAIILGTGLPEVEQSISHLEQNFPDRVRAILRFDAPLSHRIYAGADALLIPSRYEPCGLVQMIAMHYGCIPIARATGGLRDTIFDFKKSNRSTGFLFSDPTSEALTTAIRRALSAYNDQSAWHALQKRGMSQDFSWEHSADQYLELYDILVSARVNNENNFT